MRLSTFVLVAAAALTVTACGSSTGPVGIRLAELAQQEFRWQGRDVHDYTFEFHHQFGGASEAALITVNADTVSSVWDLEADTALSLDPGYDWPTVEALFGRARAAISSADVNVTVEYDPDFGYPTRIDVSPVVATPAGGSSTRASNLEPIVVFTSSGDRTATR